MARQKTNFEGLAPTTYATDDDFLRSVEYLEMILTEKEGEAWAGELLPQLSDKYDAAIKEFADTIAIRRDLQKAQEERAITAEETRDALVIFRRVVRAVFGKTSKEYRSILDQEYRGSGGEEETI